MLKRPKSMKFLVGLTGFVAAAYWAFLMIGSYKLNAELAYYFDREGAMFRDDPYRKRKVYRTPNGEEIMFTVRELPGQDGNLPDSWKLGPLVRTIDSKEMAKLFGDLSEKYRKRSLTPWIKPRDFEYDIKRTRNEFGAGHPVWFSSKWFYRYYRSE